MFMIKAIVAGIVAGAGAFGAAIADGTITGPEWAVIGGAVIAGVGAVYAAPKNATPPPAA